MQQAYLYLLGESLPILLGNGLGDLHRFGRVVLREEPPGRLWDEPGGGRVHLLPSGRWEH